MARNKVNDNGLEHNVPNLICEWYFCDYKIRNLRKAQKECSELIKLELDNAKKQGYCDSDIKELVGDISMPSYYLIDSI